MKGRDLGLTNVWPTLTPIFKNPRRSLIPCGFMPKNKILNLELTPPPK